ncbi:MAG TPA: hypothetical protein VFH06_03215 [Candidatus Saccharimonadales bacterium]|nr:hypothetical protein [Candidatus Saccharimonadales bacterium]
MSFFAQATPPSKPRTKNIQAVSLLAAGIIALMAVTQLFTFEDLPAVISGLWVPGGIAAAQTIAAVLVVTEVLSLPFLLSLRLSPLFRFVSMLLGWGVAALWILLTFWENLMVGTISNSGMLGATIPLPPGWWSVLFSIALAILVGWASWGMWPNLKQKSKK